MKSAKKEKITPVTRIVNQKPPSVASAIVFEREVGVVVASMMTRIITNCLFLNFLAQFHIAIYNTRDGFLFQLKKPRICGPMTNPRLTNQ